MSDIPYAAVPSSHDSFDSGHHENWLANGAGLGVFAHGRVHQEAAGAVYVGDLIHKRGNLATDDVLKMEEQALENMGDPLTVRSSLGALTALALLPATGTANGEGDLIAYYEEGVATFDTFKAPRATLVDGDGKVVQKGWDFERLATVVLNTVSAVGRYAVAILPRDHFFRSAYGLHFLKTVLGEGTFNPEHLNTLSQGVQPLLKADRADNLDGAATGAWTKGRRLLATVGLHRSDAHSATSLGRGFVSLNQATTFTEDRTPKPATEGVWVPDHGIQGIHQFLDLGVKSGQSSFGFLASDRDTGLHFATIDDAAEEDYRDGVWLPIESSCETGCFYGDKDGQLKKLSEGLLEGVFSECSGNVRILVRTDRESKWAVWHEFKPCDKAAGAGERFLRNEPLGQPPASHREATWFQFRIEILGYAEILDLKYGIADAGGKTGQSRCVAVACRETDHFITNLQPASTRWQDP